MMRNIEIVDVFPMACFGGIIYPVGAPRLYVLHTAKLFLNSAETYYSGNAVAFLTHETIHKILIDIESDEISDKFDNLFPSLTDAHLFIDGKMERHLLWRKKFGIKELITEI